MFVITIPTTPSIIANIITITNDINNLLNIFMFFIIIFPALNKFYIYFIPSGLNLLQFTVQLLCKLVCISD